MAGRVLVLVAALALSACAERIAVGGFIGPRMAMEIAGRIQASDAPIIELDLESPGGMVLPGMIMLAAIDEARGRARIVTRVRDHCHSMCVALFLAGDDRIAEENARFVLHGVTDLEGRPHRAMSELLIAYFRARGLDPDWIDARMAEGYLASPLDLELTGRELVGRIWSVADRGRPGPTPPVGAAPR